MLGHSALTVVTLLGRIARPGVVDETIGVKTDLAQGLLDHLLRVICSQVRLATDASGAVIVAS